MLIGYNANNAIDLGRNGEFGYNPSARFSPMDSEQALLSPLHIGPRPTTAAPEVLIDWP